MRVGIGEVEAAARDLIAPPLEAHVAALDVGAAEQQRPVERAAQLQLAAGDDLRLVVLDAQRRRRDDPDVVAQRHRAGGRDRTGRPSAGPVESAPSANTLADVSNPRVQLALFTVTVPLSIGAVAGPCSASVASTTERMPSGKRRRMSWPVAVTSNSDSS